MSEPAPVHLVTGSEPTLRGLTLDRLVDELLGGEDRSLALEDYTVPPRRAGDADAVETDVPVVSAVVTALSSPPFMTARRVVVIRDVGGLSAAQVAPLAEMVAAPTPGVYAVFVAGGGRTPAALDKALKAAGAVTVGPDSEKTGDVLGLEARAAHLRFTAAAAERVAAHFGEDAGRVPEFVELLHGAFGDGVTLDVEQIEPYLGEAGTIPRYELTGAIDRGDSAGALDVLHRLLHASSGVEAKPLHPMQVMATLVSHYDRMLRLDDPSIRTQDHAVEALGGKVKGYPARKALEQCRRLGTEGLRDALGYLAQAELDLRGASGVPEQTVMEVLVARLASLSKRYAGSRTPAGSGRRR